MSTPASLVLPGFLTSWDPLFLTFSQFPAPMNGPQTHTVLPVLHILFSTPAQGPGF